MDYSKLVDIMVEHGYFKDIEQLSDTQLMVTCPIHGDGLERTPSMGINLEKGGYNCFGCGRHGRLSALVKHFVDGVDLMQLEYVDYKRQVDLNFHTRTDKTYFNDILEKTTAYHDNIICTNGLMYLKMRREIDISKTRQFQIGGDAENIYFFVKNLNGDVVQYKTRGLYEKKFMNVKGVAKNNVLFGMYEFMKYAKGNVVVICESEIDALSSWSVGMPALAIGGTAFTEEHLEVLQFLGIRQVYLAMDEDEAGEKATEKILELVKGSSVPIQFGVIPPMKEYGRKPIKDLNDKLKLGILKDWLCGRIEEEM